MQTRAERADSRGKATAPRSGASAGPATATATSPPFAVPLQPGTVLALQATAGNRAATEAVLGGGRGRAERDAGPGAALQRQPAGPSSSRAIDPGALVLQPDDRGKPPEDMTRKELEDAIDEHTSFIDAQTRSTPEVVRREQRRAALSEALAKLAARAATAGTAAERAKGGARRGRGKGERTGKGARVMPPRPELLGRSVDWTKRPPQQARAELDRVIAYLAAGPTKDERQALELELPYLEAAAGVAREEKQKGRRREQLEKALAPTRGNEASQLSEILGRVQGAERLAGDEPLWLIHYGDQVFPLTAAELNGLRAKMGEGLIAGAAAIHGLVLDVESAWKDRNEKNLDHPIVHGLVSFTSGADDIPASAIARMVSVGGFYTRRVSDAGRAGSLVYAGDQLLVFDGFAKHWAKKVGEWDSALVGAAGNWVIALTIVKEALSIWAGLGAAKMASLAGGGFLGALKAGGTVAGVTTATGAVAGGVGAAATGGDVVKGMRTGGAAGFGVGANALTAGVGRLGSVADAAKATTKAGKVYAVAKPVLLETGANVVTSGAQAGIEGGSIGDAAKGALVTTPFNALGGMGVEKIAKGSKRVVTAGKTVVGAAAGMTSAAITGGDVGMGALVGGGGAMYGSHRANQAVAPTGGETTPAPGTTGDETTSAPATTPVTTAGEPAPVTTGGEPAPVTTGGEPAPGVVPVPAVAGSEVDARGAATLDEVGTVGSMAPERDAGGGANAVDSDLVREPGRPLSVPTGMEWQQRDPGNYREVGTASAGISGGRIVQDVRTGRKYLFKPVANEVTVPRAAERGIPRGAYGGRAAAAEIAATELGIATPHVELVRIGREKGSLTEWVETESLADYVGRDPAGFADLRQQPEFKAAQAAIDTLDYLINQVDRVQNLGNYLIEFHPDGRFKTLIPIDSELSFTSTRERAKVGRFANDLPSAIPPGMAGKLEQLGRNREAFIEAIRPLVGDEAVPGVLQRLDRLLAHAKRGSGGPP